LDGKLQISNEGGVQPVWARSGREIFYRNGAKLMVVAIDVDPAFHAQRPALLFERPFSGTLEINTAHYDVAPDGEHFVMVEFDESGSTQIEVVLNWFGDVKGQAPGNPH
jgi:hypothetical protein